MHKNSLLSYKVEQGKKIYFASDFHFGSPNYSQSLNREKLLVSWLDSIRHDATAIFLLGDIFDFWFEYRTVVPKGFVRLLGTLASISDSGIPVHLFRGNHDIWAFEYLNKELGIHLHRQRGLAELGNKRFFITHGDGLGPGDLGYKLLKMVFENHVIQRMFSWLHPDIGARIAHYFSRRSRHANNVKKAKNGGLPIQNEMMYQYAIKCASELPDIDYFVFGHLHEPTNIALNNKAKLVIIGDWITNFTYGEFDGNEMVIKSFTNKDI
ncbi:MAG TPA: UDP-2,3-diacylglucosamine diphosphatase [Bacteroidales bacterium]|nr:UDP-2,3-diacylglucosamine diphosphatase [Bacteroidales bacterium]